MTGSHDVGLLFAIDRNLMHMYVILVLAALLVLGLSDRWRREGLGPTRSEIAKAAPAPVLFVRRGTRPGLFAPSGNVTQFKWSMAGARPWSRAMSSPGVKTGRQDGEASGGEDAPSSPVS